MNRQRLAAALVLTLGATLDAQADVVTKSSVTTIARGKTTEGEWVESVQGLRMRGHWASPKAPGCRSVGLIHDATGNRVVVLRCDKQEAEVVDAVKAAAEVEKRLPARLVTTTIEPTGRSQDMLGVRCEEFAFSVKAPLNENIVLIRRGTAWVAKSGPGVEEYVAFYLRWGPIAKTRDGVTKVHLEGMSDAGVAELASLARSWESPARMRIETAGFSGGEYDPGERAASTPNEPLAFTLAASPFRRSRTWRCW